MSLYCSTKASNAFNNLLEDLNCKYIVVSYNNTYYSKSSSSANKISLETLRCLLEQCGETKVYERNHKAFNTGKTEFTGHKELLFVTKVDEERKKSSFASLLRG